MWPVSTHRTGRAAVVVDPIGNRLTARIGSLDCLRGVACLLVIACHAVFLTDVGSEPGPAQWHRVWLVGESGVVLFFVISGYLVAGPFASALVEERPLPQLDTYFFRRAARILPAWWAALAIAVAVLPIRGLPLPGKGLLVAHFSLVQLEFPRYQALSPLGVGWTLCVEAAFYVVVPMVAVMAQRICGDRVSAGRTVWALVSAWMFFAACGVAQEHFFPQPTSLAGWRSFASAALTIRYFGLFIPGTVVYLARRAGANQRPHWAPAQLVEDLPGTAAIGVSTLAAAIVAFSSSHVAIAALAFPLLSISAACCLNIALSRRTMRRRTMCHRAFRWLTRVGVLSYGLYLYHTIIMSLISVRGLRYSGGSLPFLGATASWLSSGILVFTLTLPVAFASWTMVERPLINMAAKLSTRRRLVRLPEQEHREAEAQFVRFE